MNKDTISIVMATYNGAKYIREQLESIFDQSVKPDEIIISDDCSKDDTLKIIGEYKNKVSIPIIINVNKKNQGYIKNFKFAISIAKGDYIFLCDQDDVWETDKIEITLAKMKNHSADIACTGMTLIDNNGKQIYDMKPFKTSPIIGYQTWTYNVYSVSMKRLIWGNISPGCTYCVKKSVIATYQKIADISLSHDYQLLLVGANRGKAVFIDYPLSRYRIHDNNTIGMTKKVKGEKHLQPKLVSYLNKLNLIEPIYRLWLYKIILYMRLPKMRKLLFHFGNLNL